MDPLNPLPTFKSFLFNPNSELELARRRQTETLENLIRLRFSLENLVQQSIKSKVESNQLFDEAELEDVKKGLDLTEDLVKEVGTRLDETAGRIKMFFEDLDVVFFGGVRGEGKMGVGGKDRVMGEGEEGEEEGMGGNPGLKDGMVDRSGQPTVATKSKFIENLGSGSEVITDDEKEEETLPKSPKRQHGTRDGSGETTTTVPKKSKFIENLGLNSGVKIADDENEEETLSKSPKHQPRTINGAEEPTVSKKIKLVEGLGSKSGVMITDDEEEEETLSKNLGIQHMAMDGQGETMVPKKSKFVENLGSKSGVITTDDEAEEEEEEGRRKDPGLRHGILDGLDGPDGLEKLKALKRLDPEMARRVLHQVVDIHRSIITNAPENGRKPSGNQPQFNCFEEAHKTILDNINERLEVQNRYMKEHPVKEGEMMVNTPEWEQITKDNLTVIETMRTAVSITATAGYSCKPGSKQDRKRLKLESKMKKLKT